MSFDGSSFANLLECPVCYEQFKTPPKQLPCKHTLCESCLHGLVKYNMIACPECREVSQVPTGGVAAFPNDLTMQRFLEHHRTRALQSSHLHHQQTTAAQQSPVKISGDGGDMAAQLDLQRNLQGALLLMERDKEVFGKANQTLQQEKHRYQQWRVAARKRITDVLDSVEGIVRQRKEKLLGDIEEIYQRALLNVETEEVKVDVKKQGMDKLCQALSDKLSMGAAVGGGRSDREQVAAILSQAHMVDSNLQKGLELQLTQLNLLETGMDNLLAGIRGWGQVASSPQVHKIQPSASPPPSARLPSPAGHHQPRMDSPVTVPSPRPQTPQGIVQHTAVHHQSSPSHQLPVPQTATSVMMQQQVTAKGGHQLQQAAVNPGQAQVQVQGHTLSGGEGQHVPASQEQPPVSHTQVSVQGQPPPPVQETDDETQVPMKPLPDSQTKTSNSEHIEQQPSSGCYTSMGGMAVQFGFDGGPGLLSSPLAVAELPNGTLAVTNGMTYEIKIFDSQGHHLRSISLPARGSFKHGVTGLAVHPAGHICASNPDRREVQLISMEGQVKGHLKAKVSIGEEKFCPWGLACSAQGTVYVCDRANHKIRVFNPSGAFVSSFGGRGKDVGKLDYPTGVAILGDSDIAVVDSNNNRVQVFTPEGAFIRSFGTEGSGLGELKGPADISVDQNGYIAVSEMSNHRVQIFTPEGQPVVTFGHVGSEGGQFSSPRGLVISRDGNVVVCDTKNDRVQIFQR